MVRTRTINVTRRDQRERTQSMARNKPEWSGKMCSPGMALQPPTIQEGLTPGGPRRAVRSGLIVTWVGRTPPTAYVGREVTHFGIVVPVHNEERLVYAALNALDRAIETISDPQVSIGIAVVLDRCSDRSSELVSEWRSRTARAHEAHHIAVLEVEAGNVGSARRVGCMELLREWADAPTGDIWLATTDADSEVPGDWISTQLGARNRGAQVWVGAVTVSDWTGRSLETAEVWRSRYEAEALPVHGANFGIDAATYLSAGGFTSLATGEDRDLLGRAVALGALIHEDPLVPVVTSSRRDARAPRGFAHALTSIEVAVSTALDEAELAAL